MPAQLPIDSPERRRLPPILRRAWYGLNQALRRRISHLGLTPDQFTAMRILMESDAHGLPQRELADTMSSDPNTVASLLERMEKASIVNALENLMTFPRLRKLIERGAVTLHGAYFGVAKGELSVLDRATGEFRPAGK